MQMIMRNVIFIVCRGKINHVVARVFEEDDVGDNRPTILRKT